jgi:hypothetical protein
LRIWINCIAYKAASGDPDLFGLSIAFKSLLFLAKTQERRPKNCVAEPKTHLSICAIGNVYDVSS